MHYVVTGGAGHISKPIALSLLKHGHRVTVIGRSEANLEPLTAAGATAATGSVEDLQFLLKAFAGADAVYLMIPPKWDVTNWYAFQQQVANNYLSAVKANGIKKVVVLSSVGAHLRHGAGPVDGLGYLESILDAENGVDALYLRPAYFYINLLGMIPLIKNAGILGSNFGGTGEKIVLVDTNDIADAAIQALRSLEFTGKQAVYISSTENTSDEIAAELSAAAGKPAPWVVFSDEESLQGMLAAGLPPAIANGYVQLGKSMRQGLLQEDYWKSTPLRGKVSLQQFAQVFAAGYNGAD